MSLNYVAQAPFRMKEFPSAFDHQTDGIVGPVGRKTRDNYGKPFPATAQEVSCRRHQCCSQPQKPRREQK